MPRVNLIYLEISDLNFNCYKSEKTDLVTFIEKAKGIDNFKMKTKNLVLKKTTIVVTAVVLLLVSGCLTNGHDSYIYAFREIPQHDNPNLIIESLNPENAVMEDSKGYSCLLGTVILDLIVSNILDLMEL